MKMNTMVLGVAALLMGVSASSMASAGWQAFVIENYTGDYASSADFLGAGGEGAATYIGDVPIVNFNSNGSADYTIGSWLGTGGYNYTGSIAGDTMDNTLWLFYTDARFAKAPTVWTIDDDGVEVDFGTYYQQYTGFNGSPTSATYQRGNYYGSVTDGQVGIIYNECCGPPAVLEAGVPEPSTWAMLLAGFGGLGFAAFRRARKTSIAVA